MIHPSTPEIESAPASGSPGTGYGGSCLPKDMQAFYHLSTEAGVDASLLAEAQRINRRRPGRMVEKAQDGGAQAVEVVVGVGQDLGGFLGGRIKRQRAGGFQLYKKDLTGQGKPEVSITCSPMPTASHCRQS